MITRYHKFALVAGIVLAMAFTLSCSGDDGGGDNNPGGSSSSGVSSSNNSSSAAQKCDGVEYNPATQLCDTRDGNLYRFKTIGTGATAQIWMAENLNYAVGGKCYGEDGQVYSDGLSTLSNAEIQNNCKTYGRLYDWATANTTACPSGWRLPSDADWNVLMKVANPDCTDNNACDGAGEKLKSGSSLWKSVSSLFSGNNKGTNNYGFAALPGGICNSNGIFNYVGYNGEWWSASEGDSDGAYSRGMTSINGYVSYLGNDKNALLSVRCLKDSP